MPRLGLAIPVSPHQKPVDFPSQPASNGYTAALATPPPLRLNTPMGSNTTPQEGRVTNMRRLPPLQLPALSTGGSSDTSAHSRSGSSGEMPPANGRLSEFAQILRHSTSGDPLSAVSSAYSAGGEVMEREGSMGLFSDLAKLSLEKGRPLDVEDLDDAGWYAASNENKIKELGSLGEGAGGAVTRCILEGGKTVFALKVCPNPRFCCCMNHNHSSRSSPPIRTQMSRSRF